MDNAEARQMMLYGCATSLSPPGRFPTFSEAETVLARSTGTFLVHFEALLSPVVIVKLGPVGLKVIIQKSIGRDHVGKGHASLLLPLLRVRTNEKY